MVRRRGLTYSVTVYDPDTQGKRWVGTFDTEHEALEAEAHAKAGRSFTRRQRTPLERLQMERRRVVYFIGAPSLGLVKIGYSEDLASRFTDLSVGSPVELRLLHVIPGDVDDERALHKRFALYRVRGEWFRITGTLAAFLEDVVREPSLRLVDEEAS